MNLQFKTSHRMTVAPSVSSQHPGYMPGFGNDFETEALPDALPQGMNSPQKCNYGLYGEQLSGTAFTAPGHQNERTWCYRIRPSVRHTHRFEQASFPYWKSAPNIVEGVVSLGQYRWDPIPHSDQNHTWMSGMRTITTAGDVNTQTGMASHVYLVTESMIDDYFFPRFIHQLPSRNKDTQIGRGLRPLKIAHLFAQFLRPKAIVRIQKGNEFTP